MIIDDLGYRKPSKSEILGAFKLRAQDIVKADVTNDEFGLPVAHLHHDPLITYSGIVPAAPLAFASVTKYKLRKRKMWVLASPTWLLTANISARSIRAAAICHRTLNPHHKIIFMCNSADEVFSMLEVGEAALFHNKTSCVPEQIFKPIANTPLKFDAIYNARLTKWKRHDLTTQIENCSFIYYRPDNNQKTIDQEQKILSDHANKHPGHVFLNQIDETGQPVRFEPEDVNQHMNSASVGLCLSPTEGAMLASVECMLAGLPVVSTPSQGGRDVFYDDEYCIIADPDPNQIAAAVRALKAKNIPREYIYNQTLARITEHRERFINLFNEILTEEGAPTRMPKQWPFTRTPTAGWMHPSRALRRALKQELDDYGQLNSFVTVEEYGTTTKT